MRHFATLKENELEKIFYKKPMNINKNIDKSLLPLALGATMYTPATNTELASRILNKKNPELISHVWCLEDAISESSVEEAEENLDKQIDKLNEYINSGKMLKQDLPLIFVRIRSIEQLETILEKGNSLDVLAGFNIPKFTSLNGKAYLSLINNANKKYKINLFAMPILESEEIMYQETRREELIKIKTIIDNYSDIILNIRLGGTDFSSLFGMRRGIDFTIYDISVINNCLSDIINLFGRATEDYTISGVVWEYFPDNNRLLKPQLRKTPFVNNIGSLLGLVKRKNIIEKEIDGLIKEIILDKANGIVGKTIIHPSHIRYVNALQTVTYEEYVDALRITENSSSGVIKSENGNKMNEIKPHTNWAIKILKKAEIYGVLNSDKKYIDLF